MKRGGKPLALLWAWLLALALLAGCVPGSLTPPAATASPDAGELVLLTPTPETETGVPKDTDAPRPAEEGTPVPIETETPAPMPSPESTPTPVPLAEDGSYTSAEDVALYLHLYGRLPGNFISKDKARALGWSGGSLEAFAPGMCIGGDRFGNYEGLLPTAPGRRYTECDIDTLGARGRGVKRLVWSNDGLIYYTRDHYESFTLLYGEP